MRNITSECTIRILKSDISTMEPSGGGDCSCRQPGDINKDFVLIYDHYGDVVWYARTTCPIHGLKAEDVETPPSADSSTT